MSNFDAAIGIVLQHEGGYSNDPADPGGETNFGISKRAHPDVDIPLLTEEQAIEIYRKNYWRPEYEEMPQRLAIKVFDMAVNMGWPQAHKILQGSLNSLAYNLKIDAIVGPKTLAAIEDVNLEWLLRDLRARHSFFYANLAINKPEMRRFLLGWLHRAAL